MKVIKAFGNEKPVLDTKRHTSNTATSGRGIQISVEVTGIFMVLMHRAVWDICVWQYNIMSTAFYGKTGQRITDFPVCIIGGKKSGHNLILSCESYDNYDEPRVVASMNLHVN